MIKSALTIVGTAALLLFSFWLIATIAILVSRP